MTPATQTITADVAIVGGGAAGLATAIALARSLRQVVVIDAGSPRNRTSAHARNVLGHEGINPLDLVAKGRQEAEGYGVTFIDATVTGAQSTDTEAARPHQENAPTGGHSPAKSAPTVTGSHSAPAEAAPTVTGTHSAPSEAAPTETGTHSAPAEAAPTHRFILDTTAGTRVTAQHVVIATGITDELPEIPGLAEGWGDTVLHCPYCHGYEVRGQSIGIIGTTALSYHQAMMFSQLSDRVTFIRHAAPNPTPEQAAMLDALGIAFVDAQIDAVHRTASGTEVTLRSAAGASSINRPSADRSHATASEVAGAPSHATASDDRAVSDTTAAGFTAPEVTAAPEHGAAASDDTASAITLDALVVGPFFRANGEVFSQLGGSVVEDPSGMGSSITADPTGRTDIPGVWAVGNVADMSAMLGASAASGVRAGAMINYELIQSALAG
ncbi:FAD-dependent oxidoreductase [Brevibacterium sp. XM4083]|uniref:FAD-dependent oxidoreductase n=1 Tax=Brevibacterium sp. XM4083 TaxID=2583238 RepID=UPI00112844E1|nr:FAD-dependent oxidoreductase [Brevibacterium sp. XM4083]MCM1011412.1 FAD-dependent oxidoreductase [Brevibacterium sp. XM4083]